MEQQNPPSPIMDNKTRPLTIMEHKPASPTDQWTTKPTLFSTAIAPKKCRNWDFRELVKDWGRAGFV
ncbi:hypothetical protein MC7420_4471 [Coleofasciculus chthonoplastes PCC 7420]|uniref:Uncharacterized protein n=1 Tax=Coleofasciculus chthonoplastes PCC 7420 TaxID=118168 RepID=B4VY12_9CYAN|nr:hypothetical protein MC7420_4471 [Coleofasciculus chthonoplastes PCC 7420]